MTSYSDVRIFLCTTPTNINVSFDRLMGRVQEVYDQDPCSGHLFLFMNRHRDRMKILFGTSTVFASGTSGWNAARSSFYNDQRRRGY